MTGLRLRLAACAALAGLIAAAAPASIGITKVIMVYSRCPTVALRRPAEMSRDQFLHGRAAMRVSVTNWSTDEADVDRSVAAILEIANNT